MWYHRNSHTHIHMLKLCIYYFTYDKIILHVLLILMTIIILCSRTDSHSLYIQILLISFLQRILFFLALPYKQDFSLPLCNFAIYYKDFYYSNFNILFKLVYYYMLYHCMSLGYRRSALNYFLTWLVHFMLNKWGNVC